MSETLTLHEAYEQVIAINALVGNVAAPSRETLQHQTRIIESEAQELCNGIAEADVREIRDGIADVLFTNAGAYGRLALPLPRRIDPVYIENEEQVKEITLKIRKICTAIQIVGELSFDNYYGVVERLLHQQLEYTVSLALYFGYPFIDDLVETCRSNWTKFDRDEATALKTREKYLAIGVQVTQKDVFLPSASGEQSELYIVTYSAYDQKGSDGKDYPGKKWLKSVNFEDTVFSEPSDDVQGISSQSKTYPELEVVLVHAGVSRDDAAVLPADVVKVAFEDEKFQTRLNAGLIFGEYRQPHRREGEPLEIFAKRVGNVEVANVCLRLKSVYQDPNDPTTWNGTIEPMGPMAETMMELIQDRTEPLKLGIRAFTRIDQTANEVQAIYLVCFDFIG